MGEFICLLSLCSLCFWVGWIAHSYWMERNNDNV